MGLTRGLRGVHRRGRKEHDVAKKTETEERGSAVGLTESNRRDRRARREKKMKERRAGQLSYFISAFSAPSAVRL
jgi:hypothetical protein